MHTFKDNADRTWVVSINVNSVKKCRGVLQVDLYGLVDDGFEKLAKLLGDPVTLVDVLYVLCRSEADARGVSDEDFGRAMAGDALDHAATAFLEELTDFFPDPRVRAALRRVMEAGRKVQARLMDHLTTTLDGIDPDSEAEKLIASSGTSRGPSGSTPDPSPSASLT